MQRGVPDRVGGVRDARSGVAKASAPPNAADRMAMLQRSIGNRAGTRLLARYKSTSGKLREGIASGDWGGVAYILSEFDKSGVALTLGTLNASQLRYLDDAINRQSWTGKDKMLAQVRAEMKAKGAATQRTKPGQAYGKATGKYGKVKDGKDRYEVEVDLDFEPDPALVGADEISWIQTVRTIDADTLRSNEPGLPDQARTSEKQWMVDRVEHRKHGWYGINDDASASGNVDPWTRNGARRTAHLWDQPGWNVKGMVWEYEAAAVCRVSSPGGDPVGTVYAVIGWGFSVSEKGKVKTHKIKVWNKPSPRQLEAVAKWNLQAQGALTPKNSPDQQQLPALQ